MKKPKYLKNKDPWLLAEDLTGIDLFFAQIWLSSFVNDMKKTAGLDYKKVLSVHKKGFFQKYYYGENDCLNFAKKVLEKIDKNLKFGDLINKQIYLWSDKLVEFAKKVNQTGLTKKTNQQLWQLYQKHDQIHTNLYQWGWLPNAIDMFHSELTEKLKNYLSQIISNQVKINEYLVILTTPNKRSILDQERIEFLKIAQQIEKDKMQKKLFLTGNLKKIKNNLCPTFKKLIQKHYQKYHHLKYLFLGLEGVYTFDYYLKELANLIKTHLFEKKVEIALTGAFVKKVKIKSIKDILKLEENKILIQKRKKEGLFKKLKVSSHYRKLFNLWGEFMLSKLYRRNTQILNFYLLEKLLKEVAKRLDISFFQLRYMLPLEVKKALLTGKLNKKTLKERMNFCVYYAEKEREAVFIGKLARRLAQMVEQRKFLSITELKGQCGNVGFAKGRVKLVIVFKDMVKFKKGDILVSTVTNPDLVPAMKKAAAIITNQGGVTSHAAIVSRELGVPCIIGTKIATKILHDGQLVEVDANKGVIKIIK